MRPPTALTPVEVLELSVRGEPVDAASVGGLVRAWLDGVATDAQMAAWCAAACGHGLDDDATEALTRALVASGDRLELATLGPTGDTHSTGGVGDSTTLAAAPIAAALGVRVAKACGRGLGHTGGTADKLEAIPGYRVDMPLDRFVRQVRDVGIAVVGPSDRLAPADARLYALRDQTGTVRSAGLIAASIMSKKIAGGAGAIVLDVKVGDGAFFASADEAREAARMMAALARPWGRRVVWTLSAMEQPLGRRVGNGLEVGEAGQVLCGEGPADLRALSLRVAADVAEAAGVVGPGDGPDRAAAAVADGSALAAAERWVEAQGGNPAVWSDDDVLPAAPERRAVEAPRGGWVRRLGARRVGEAARWLGAGRLHHHQTVDPVAGLELLAKVGERVEAGDPLAVVHARDPGLAARGAQLFLEAVELGDMPPDPAPLIIDRGGADA